MGGIGASAAPMNGYPKVFNIESDPHEEHNIGEMYEWVLGPVLKAVEEYKASLRSTTTRPQQTSRDFSANAAKRFSAMIAIHNYDATSFIYVKVPALVVLASETVIVAARMI